MVIAYAKFSKGVIATIETTDYKWVGGMPTDYHGNTDSTKQLYVTTNFKILSLEYVNGKHIDTHIVQFNGITSALNYYLSIELKYDIKLEVNNIYVGIPITFYLIKELAFMKNFGLEKEWELFENGYSGLFEAYDEYGCLVFKCFHINGIVHEESVYLIKNYSKDFAIFKFGLQYLNI